MGNSSEEGENHNAGLGESLPSPSPDLEMKSQKSYPTVEEVSDEEEGESKWGEEGSQESERGRGGLRGK